MKTQLGAGEHCLNALLPMRQGKASRVESTIEGKGPETKKKRRDKMHDADDEGIDHDDGDGDGGRRERNKKMKIKHKNPIPHLDKIEGHDLNPIDRELEPWY